MISLGVYFFYHQFNCIGSHNPCSELSADNLRFITQVNRRYPLKWRRPYGLNHSSCKNPYFFFFFFFFFSFPCCFGNFLGRPIPGQTTLGDQVLKGPQRTSITLTFWDLIYTISSGVRLCSSEGPKPAHTKRIFIYFYWFIYYRDLLRKNR